MRKKMFNNESECTFDETNSDFCMDVSNRERALLVLHKRFCWGRSVFDEFNDWTDFKGEFMHYYEKHYAQTKARDREKKRASDSSDESDEYAENDENDDSWAEEDVHSRFSSVLTVPDEAHMQKKIIPEHKKKVLML